MTDNQLYLMNFVDKKIVSLTKNFTLMYSMPYGMKWTGKYTLQSKIMIVTVYIA